MNDSILAGGRISSKVDSDRSEHPGTGMLVEIRILQDSGSGSFDDLGFLRRRDELLQSREGRLPLEARGDGKEINGSEMSVGDGVGVDGQLEDELQAGRVCAAIGASQYDEAWRVGESEYAQLNLLGDGDRRRQREGSKRTRSSPFDDAVDHSSLVRKGEIRQFHIDDCESTASDRGRDSR